MFENIARSELPRRRVGTLAQSAGRPCGSIRAIRFFQQRESERTMENEQLLVYGLGLLGGGPRFRIFWRPVLGRKRDAPELRTARGKFQADFRFVAADRAKKHNATFLLFPGGVVSQRQQAAAGDARLQ